jgi:hypothetical protein
MVNILTSYFNSKRITTKNIEFTTEEDKEYKICNYTIRIPKNVNTNQIIEDLSKKSETFKINIVK